MEKIPTNIAQELIKFYSNQEKLIIQYSSENNREMCYLVQWSVLEKFIKTIASEYRRSLLRESLNAWLSYLESSDNRPSKNPQTAIEINTLPNKSEFIASLKHYGFNGDEIWALMDSKGKFRRYRNELAHTGKRFNSLVYYSMYPA